MVYGLENSQKIISNFLVGLDAFVFVADSRGVLTYKNDYFKEKLRDVISLDQIEHYFSFDICVIKEDEIMSYTPLRAAFISEENFFAAAKFEQKRHSFRKVIIKTFLLAENKLFIVSYEDLEKKNSELDKAQKELDKLKSIASENQLLKQRAENQSVKTALINRVSSAIRDTLDIQDILKKALSETVKTLGANGVAFYNKGEKEPCYKYKFKDDTSFSLRNTKTLKEGTRLVVPVSYVSNLLGYIVVLKNEWQDDEIALVENIASQIAIALNQASLFSEVEKQKEELTNTLKQLQEAQLQLVQSEKMASLGQLVAGIAHEINTPLGAINSNNYMIKKCLTQVEGNESILKLMDKMIPVNEDAIGRINTLVKSLKNFARLDEMEFQQANLIDGINSTLDLIRHETRENIKIIKNFSQMPLVQCQPNAINQVLMNILVNACQAIESDGVISISTWHKENNVFIKIADTGKGIEKDNLTKVFDPGFTTKGVGVGTGLGLSISYKIIQEHGGDITVSSDLGKGAIFIIRLPIER